MKKEHSYLLVFLVVAVVGLFSISVLTDSYPTGFAVRDKDCTRGCDDIYKTCSNPVLQQEKECKQLKDNNQKMCLENPKKERESCQQNRRTCRKSCEESEKATKTSVLACPTPLPCPPAPVCPTPQPCPSVPACPAVTPCVCPQTEAPTTQPVSTSTATQQSSSAQEPPRSSANANQVQTPSTPPISTSQSPPSATQPLISLLTKRFIDTVTEINCQAHEAVCGAKVSTVNGLFDGLYCCALNPSVTDFKLKPGGDNYGRLSSGPPGEYRVYTGQYDMRGQRLGPAVICGGKSIEQAIYPPYTGLALKNHAACDVEFVKEKIFETTSSLRPSQKDSAGTVFCKEHEIVCGVGFASQSKEQGRQTTTGLIDALRCCKVITSAEINERRRRALEEDPCAFGC